MTFDVFLITLTEPCYTLTVGRPPTHASSTKTPSKLNESGRDKSTDGDVVELLLRTIQRSRHKDVIPHNSPQHNITQVTVFLGRASNNDQFVQRFSTS